MIQTITNQASHNTITDDNLYDDEVITKTQHRPEALAEWTRGLIGPFPMKFD